MGVLGPTRSVNDGRMALPLAVGLALLAIPAPRRFEQARRIEHRLDDTARLKPVGLEIRAVPYRGRTAVHVVTPPHSKEGAVVLVPGTDMLNGTIEADVAGRPMAGAPPDARGFIGLAFRAVDDSTYDSFYIRPTNGRAHDQVRRNHSTQYIAAPSFLFDRLREEGPGAYESYVDLVAGEWTHLRIDVSDSMAALYVNRAEQPCLIVNRLKGRHAPGLVGLWIGDQTDGYFSRLSVTARSVSSTLMADSC